MAPIAMPSAILNPKVLKLLGKERREQHNQMDQQRAAAYERGRSGFAWVRVATANRSAKWKPNARNTIL